MSEQRTIIGVEVKEHPAFDGSTVPRWDVITQDEEGRTHIYLVPTDCLAIRAAEYGVDPSDVAGLVDMVIHEHHAPAPAAAADTSGGPARRAGLGVDSAPVDLFNAPSKRAALQAHRARLDQAKQTRTRVVDPHGILSRLVASHEVDPGLVQKADVVHRRIKAQLSAGVDAPRS